jgi:hypothetical protein
MDKRIYANIDFVPDWPNRTSQGKNEAGREEVLHAIFGSVGLAAIAGGVGL